MGAKETAITQLRCAINASLTEADRLGCESLAIPAVHSFFETCHMLATGMLVDDASVA